MLHRTWLCSYKLAPFLQLSNADRDMLNSPITLTELTDALEEALHHKSPGSDSLPSEVYSHYGEVLLPPLLQALSEAVETGCLPDSMQKAIIVVLPKPSKDRLLPDSYRPISLMNADNKLLARVLATRLSQVIGKLVHCDQSGFIPTHSMADNIRCLYITLHVPVDNPGGRAILSLDAAKAFYGVEWPYLQEILARFRLGSHFIAWVKVLYSSPRARLRINNNLSSPFELHRGTQQGCPLFPLLFALAVEPLVILIRTAPEVVGFRRGKLENKTCLYADYAFIYLGDSTASLRAVMGIIMDFRGFSGFTINCSKSTLMPIDPLTEPLPVGANQIAIVNSFRYLRVVVSPDPAKYLRLNQEPLLHRQKVKCTSWCKLPVGGRTGEINKNGVGSAASIHFS